MGYYVTSARVISRCMQLEFGVRQKSRSTPGDWKLTFHFRGKELQSDVNHPTFTIEDTNDKMLKIMVLLCPAITSGGIP